MEIPAARSPSLAAWAAGRPSQKWRAQAHAQQGLRVTRPTAAASATESLGRHSLGCNPADRQTRRIAQRAQPAMRPGASLAGQDPRSVAAPRLRRQRSAAGRFPELFYQCSFPKSGGLPTGRHQEDNHIDILVGRVSITVDLVVPTMNRIDGNPYLEHRRPGLKLPRNHSLGVIQHCSGHGMASRDIHLHERICCQFFQQPSCSRQLAHSLWKARGVKWPLPGTRRWR